MQISQLSTYEQVRVPLSGGSAKEASRGLGAWLGSGPPCGLWREDSSVCTVADSLIGFKLKPKHATPPGPLPYLTPQSLP